MQVFHLNNLFLVVWNAYPNIIKKYEVKKNEVSKINSMFFLFSLDESLKSILVKCDDLKWHGFVVVTSVYNWIMKIYLEYI